MMKIKKRQFAFTGASLTGATESMEFKCEVKVCPTANEATCSTTKKDGQPSTCPARTYYDPSRKRRTLADQTKLLQLSKDGFKK